MVLVATAASLRRKSSRTINTVASGRSHIPQTISEPFFAVAQQYAKNPAPKQEFSKQPQKKAHPTAYA
jgi:hypothetical protein